MKRPASFLGIFLLLGSSALGQSYDLTVHLSSGESVVMPLDDILRIEFTGIFSGVEEPVGLATAVHALLLLQNYPNPSRPSTTIEYEIPAEANVSVRIFDLQGALVRELLQETQSAGRHRVIWDGTAASGAPVASGMYVYAVECGGQGLSQRLILVR